MSADFVTRSRVTDVCILEILSRKGCNQCKLEDRGWRDAEWAIAQAIKEPRVLGKFTLEVIPLARPRKKKGDVDVM